VTLSLVGSLVGPVGTPAPSGSAALIDAGEGYDFAIGGHGFRLAISDERKYERATAQFRKEQYDSSDSPGDQSLLGYWTRGQLSFHKGAGQRYAELGDDTDARYWTGVGANPFVKGEVTLYPSWGSATLDSYTGINDCLPVGTSGLAVLADGRITYGDLGAAGTTHPDASASRAANSVTVGGGNIYAAMSDERIDRIGLALTYPVVYGEQGFESSVDSWATDTFFATYEVAAVSLDAAVFDTGAQSLKVVWPVSGATDRSNVVRAVTGLTAGQAYTLVARVFCTAGTGANVRGLCLGVAVGSAVTTEGSWVTYSMTFTATGTSHAIGFENANLGASTADFWVDGAVVYEGARTGYDSGATPIDSIYSHTEALLECHYAKDRLFVMDALGAWYQLAPNPSAALPVAIASGDKVFTATTEGGWSVCETPGPVLFANGNRVFSSTQDADGLFPTLGSPVQVADLPIGESVVSMGYYLGFVVLVTTKGVRVAVVGDSGITYGPRLTEWSVDPYRTGVARVGESVFIAADDRIIEVNLGSQIGDGLEFGWTDLPTPFSAATHHGVTQVDGSVVAWGGDVLDIQQSDPVASGYLETSFHRFGTLEPKKFHTVRVRASGDGGSVTISKVTPEGSVISLYTMPVGDGEADVTLRADEPLDRLALRFTLNADGANSPKLLSYQLRALPAPKRQRMIRVPLALHDVEKRGTTRASGHVGGAWERLRALETLEAESGIVTYQDFRTGESGQCYIEQVAHEGNTPPGRQGDGFGGVVFVTLRTL
jgi:hypothetical protein